MTATNAARHDDVQVELVIADDLGKVFDIFAAFAEPDYRASGEGEAEGGGWGELFDSQGHDLFAGGRERPAASRRWARLLVGLYAPTSGRIAFDGIDMAAPRSRAEDKALRSRLQMIFQDPYASLNPRWRVRDIIAEPIRAFGLAADRPLDERVGELLTQVGLSPVDGEKIPARILRRSAPAHLDRASRSPASPNSWCATSRHRRWTSRCRRRS